MLRRDIKQPVSQEIDKESWKSYVSVLHSQTEEKARRNGASLPKVTLVDRLLTLRLTECYPWGFDGHLRSFYHINRHLLVLGFCSA